MAFVKTKLACRVPTDLKKNLEFRKKIYARVRTDRKFAKHIIDGCRKDPIFFINTFCWTYDPRKEPFSRIPMILYDFQEEAVLVIANSLNKEDLLIEKTRDMGASWICILTLFWAWRFSRNRISILLGSRVESYVDDTENPKSLMWKWDYVMRNLPNWVKPKGYNENEHRRHLHILNPETGSVTDGESTNKNFARGDRRTAILLDEFAAVEQGDEVLRSTRDATNCRIFNSTPCGVGNAFYDVRQTGIRKLRLHWSSHPLKNPGLYMTSDDGNLKVLDPKGFPSEYKPILDGKIRSPWYDKERERSTSDREIAQELDIDYLGSGHQFFSATAVLNAIRDHASEPVLIGDLEFDSLSNAEPKKFREDEEGKLRLWFHLDKDGNPPNDYKRKTKSTFSIFRQDNPNIGAHPVVIGVDVSAGTGSSNSALCAWDTVTHEKIAEYVDPYIRPEALAYYAVALAKWLGHAKLIWEQNGPGRQFGARVQELMYNNIYLRSQSTTIENKATIIPGWAPTKESKLLLLGNYRDAIESGTCANRSKISLEETLEYVYGTGGGVEHSRAKNKTDPSGAGASHGDRVIADALAWKCIDGYGKGKQKPELPKAPYGSLQWRIDQKKKDQKKPHKILGKGW